MQAQVNYHDVWIRWVAISTLSKGESKNLLRHLHREIKAGCELIGKTATEQIVSDESESGLWNTKISTVFSTVVSAVYGGYFLYLLVHAINPETDQLPKRISTEQVGAKWVAALDSNNLEKRILAIDPVIKLMLSAIADVRLEQLVGLIPESIHRSYKDMLTVEQHISWCVGQGYVLGELEQNLAG